MAHRTYERLLATNNKPPQAARISGASTIIGVDINPAKFELATKLGATACVNPADHEGLPSTFPAAPCHDSDRQLPT